jgi:hypothetical protein
VANELLQEESGTLCLPPEGAGGPFRPAPILDDADRKGLHYCLHLGPEGQEKDWLHLRQRMEEKLRRYLRRKLWDAGCRDEDTVNDLLQRVWVEFFQREPARLMRRLEKLGSVLGYLMRLARNQLWRHEYCHLLRRKHETAAAHRENETVSVILTEAELDRILGEIKFSLPAKQRKLFLDHLANPTGPDKAPLTAQERQRLRRLRKALLGWLETR